MTPGEQKLKGDMEQAGWHNVHVVPETERADRHSVEAWGTDAPHRSDYTIGISGGRDGYIQRYELVRNDDGVRTGEISWSRGVPTPEQAVGALEQRQAKDARDAG